MQLNSILFAKTLVRKDVASASGSAPGGEASEAPRPAGDEDTKKKEDENTFSSKAQIMTLMTTDVDRVSEFAWHIFTLVDSPIEVVIGTLFLYHLLGVSCFFGLAVTCLFLPLNHFAGKVVVGAQDNLMKARDERVALMNEVCLAFQVAVIGRADAVCRSLVVSVCSRYIATTLPGLVDWLIGTFPVHGLGAQLRAARAEDP